MIYPLAQEKQSVITCTIDYDRETHNFNHSELLSDTLNAMNSSLFYYSHFVFVDSYKKIQFTFKRLSCTL